MKDLLEAMTIFAKYTDAEYPTHCEHDELFVLVNPKDVSVEDVNRLSVLGFNAKPRDGHFSSFRFGSA